MNKQTDKNSDTDKGRVVTEGKEGRGVQKKTWGPLFRIINTFRMVTADHSTKGRGP